MNANLLAALAAFLGGALIALINSLILAKQAKSESQSVSGVVIIRQLLGFVYLAGTFYVARKMNLEIQWPLIGAAAGLTIPSIFFAFTIAKQMKGDD